MGTDIHLEVEVKRNGKWERLPHPETPCWSCAPYDPETGERGEPLGYFHPWLPVNEIPDGVKVIDYSDVRNGRVQVDTKEPCHWCKGTKIVREQWYHDRNYNVFGVLADVRNGRGFAGTVTGTGFVPIAEPRGLPSDLSEEVIAQLARMGEKVENGDLVPTGTGRSDDLYDEMSDEPEGWWDLGEHSLSWVTLEEVLDTYDWERTTTQAGWVDPWNFELWRRNGKPNSWSGGVSGRAVENISGLDMAAKIDEGDIVFGGDEEEWLAKRHTWDTRPYTTGIGRFLTKHHQVTEGSVGQAIAETHYYCPVTWETPYRECMGDRFFVVMESLREHIPAGGTAADVRLVFGFDS